MDAVPAGNAWALCRACGETFASVVLFDLHRTGVRVRKCVDLGRGRTARLGAGATATKIVCADNGVWGTEAQITKTERLRGSRAVSAASLR